MTQKMMNVWRVSHHRVGTEGFQFLQVPQPRAKEGELLMKGHAYSFNPIESKIRMSHVQIAPTFPAILNEDIAEEVIQLGEDVHNLDVGNYIHSCLDDVGEAYAYASSGHHVGIVSPVHSTDDLGHISSRYKEKS